MGKRRCHGMLTRSQAKMWKDEAGSNEESPPDIFKLNNDCFDEVFDFLTLDELVAVGQTCKHLNEEAGQIFKRRYPNAIAQLMRGNLRIGRVQINCFIRFVRNISLNHLTLSDARFIASNRFASLEHLRLSNTELSAALIECIKGNLAKLEIIKLINCKCNNDLYEEFLKFCVSLKRLVVRTSHEDGFGTNWFLQKYPMLEHFELNLDSKQQIDELKTFLEQNPNLQSVSIDKSTLWMNQVPIAMANAKLQVLEIHDIRKTIPDPNTFWNLVNELHVRGFYQRLHVRFNGHIDHNKVSQLISLDAFEKLSIFNGWFENNTCGALAALINMKELQIDHFDYRWYERFEAMNSIAMNCLKLEHISFNKAPINAIIPFIIHSPILKTIHVFYLMGHDEQLVDGDIFDEWNKERAKLARASKVTVYVHDKIYLRTKWTQNRTNYGLIEVKRYPSYLFIRS